MREATKRIESPNYVAENDGGHKIKNTLERIDAEKFACNLTKKLVHWLPSE